MILLKIGNRIRRIRQKKRLSQLDVCKDLISPSHYSNIENGRYLPSLDTLKNIAQKLNIPITYFTEFESNSTELQSKLNQLEKMLYHEQTKLNKEIVQDIDSSFPYISSIHQEVQYNFLKFLFLLKTSTKENALSFFDNNIIELEIHETTIDHSLYKQSIYIFGLYYFHKELYEESIQYFKKQLTVDNSETMLAKVFYNISLAYFHLYKYNLAVYYIIKAKDAYLNLHKWSETGDCYNLLAALFIRLSSYPQAEQNLHKGIDICPSEDVRLKTLLYHNLAVCHFRQKKYTSALEYIDQAINFKTQSLFLSYKLKIEILLDLGDILYAKKMMKDIQQYTESDLEMSEFKFLEAQIQFLLEDFIPYLENMEYCVQHFLALKEWDSLFKSSAHYSSYLNSIHKYKKAFEIQSLSVRALKNMTGG